MFWLKSQKSCSREPEIKKFLFVSFPSDPHIPKPAKRICHYFPFETTVLPLRHYHKTLLSSPKEAVLWGTFCVWRAPLSLSKEGHWVMEGQITVQIKTQQKTQHQLSKNGSYFKNILVQKNRFRIDEYFFTSRRSEFEQFRIIYSTYIKDFFSHEKKKNEDNIAVTISYREALLCSRHAACCHSTGATAVIPIAGYLYSYKGMYLPLTLPNLES